MKTVLKSSFGFNVHYAACKILWGISHLSSPFNRHEKYFSFSTEIHGRYTFTEVNCGQNSRENRFEENCVFQKYFKLMVNVDLYWKCTTNISPFGEISSVWQ